VGESNALWYQDAIIYELHVRTFSDSAGDGVGDFRGLIERLDYLQDLGVTTLWLLPFYPSPLRDDGYDIADYTSVNPSYGTLADFDAFLAEAHRRGLRVIGELVVNHTSDQHPWFRRARAAKPGTPERDFYVWSDTPDRYADVRIIFKDYEASNWTWDAQAGAYYWHRFYSHQPDLNYDNPAVRDAVAQVLDFWLARGLDGMRLDAVPYLYEREGTTCENLPETHAFLRRLRSEMDAKYPGRMLLGEANQWPEDAFAYFGNGDECNMIFHFPVMPRLFMAIRMEDRLPIVDILEQTPAVPDGAQWAVFLRNHDELTLEMVTDEDRDYMYRVYAQDPQARINLGIRRRLAPLLEGHRGKIELMNGLLFSLPGTPVIYYGDEIGMGDNIYLGDRNGVRTPMQWDAGPNAGFSRANPQRLCLPVVIDQEHHYETVNVEAQQNSRHSLLWWMKHLIAVRKSTLAFGRGSLEFLTPRNPKVLAFVRRYQQETVLVVANLSRFAQAVELDLTAWEGLVPVEMFGRTRFPAVGAAPYMLTLGPYAFYWFALEARRPLSAPELHLVPELTVDGPWDNVARGRTKAGIQRLLPAYLQRAAPPGALPRTIESVTLLDSVPVPGLPYLARVGLAQVSFRDGDPEMVAVPLAFLTDERAASVAPAAVLANLHLRAPDGVITTGVICDPARDPEFAAGFLRAVAEQQRWPGTAGSVCATACTALDVTLPLPPPTFHAELAGMAAVWRDNWVLTQLRGIEPGFHPRVEVERFLREQASFPHVPAVLGVVEYQPLEGEPLTLAVLEQFVPHQVDAWNHTLSAAGAYLENALVHPAKAPADAADARPLLDLLGQQVPTQAQELIGPFLELARQLGQRTGELHRALASERRDPAFAPEPFSPAYQRSLYETLRSQVRRTLRLLRERRGDLPEAAAREADRLLERERKLLQAARRILEQPITAQRIRCHGDYHLGHVLLTGKDLAIIGFDGESDRRLVDRRRKRSPLRDVAAMLHSFHYAARVARGKGSIRPEDAGPLEPWITSWHRWVSTVFLGAYLEIAAPVGFLPQRRDALELMLDFFLLKRAVHDLWQDLHRRPDRLLVPLELLALITDRLP